MTDFDQGGVPHIAVYNRAATPLGLDLAALVAAMQSYVTLAVAPIWGTPATLSLETGPVPASWNFVFLDDADSPGALAYHDLDTGLPISKVFVRTTLQAGEKVSVSAAHELVEMLVDPGINLWAEAQDGSMAAYEAADPVEESDFDVAGFAMSNFVYPAFFEDWRPAGSAQFDHLKMLTRPLQIDKGGYQIVLKDGKVSQVMGSSDKTLRFAREDRRGHRSEGRNRKI